MSKKNLQLAGLYDIQPTTMLKRQYLIGILQKNFKQYGFLPIQTPAIERLDVLTGKYGQEGEQLLFKILNSGDFLAKTTEQDYKQGASALLPKITKKGLRYDLTVPLARYIASHRNTTPLPFKRFQIQPVWRAEKPQKNRHREFYQCDADVIGNPSLFSEAEMLAMVIKITNDLHLTNFAIHINHRLIFKALATQLQAPDKDTLLCRVLDKLDKIGKEKVIELLTKQGISTTQLNSIDWIFTLQGTIQHSIPTLEKHIDSLPEGRQAIADLQKFLHYIQTLKIPPHLLIFTPTLARGMDYYTGLIFELKAHNLTTSLGAGGRYDQLTTSFGLPAMPSVGFSFGLERLYNWLESNNLIPTTHLHTISLLLVPLASQQEDFTLQCLHTLRKATIPTEMYLTGTRLHKAFDYAQHKNIPWVAIIGEQEVATSTLSLKHLSSKEKNTYSLQQLIQRMKKGASLKKN